MELTHAEKDQAVQAEILEELNQDIALRQFMANERDQAQEIMDACSQRIASKLALMGGKYENQEWVASLVVGERKGTVDPKKLLEQGVGMETILKATGPGSSYSQLRVVARK